MTTANNDPLAKAQTEDLRQIRELAIVLAMLLERYQFNPVVAETLDDIAHSAGRLLEARGVGESAS